MSAPGRSDPLLDEAFDLAARAGLPPEAREVCVLLGVLAGERGARRLLEIARAPVASTLCLARAAAAARLVSVDVSGERPAELAGLLERAGVETRVELLTDRHEGAAPGAGGPVLPPPVEGRFDQIHLDLEPRRVLRLVDRLLPSLEVGGLLVVRGLSRVSGGETAATAPDGSGQAEAVAGYLLMHPQLRAQSLPLAGGVLVARKLAPLVTELGGPF